MTQLWMDGFDHYGTGSAGRLAMLNGVWAELDNINAEPVIPSFGARTGAVALRTGTSIALGNLARRVLPAAETELFVGQGFYVPQLPDVSDRVGLIAFTDTFNDAVVSISVGSDGTLRVRGPTTGNFNQGANLGVSIGPVIVAGTWHHLETRVVVSATVGIVEIRVDGNLTAAVDLTGKNTGTNAIAQVVFGTPKSNSPLVDTPKDVYYDDIVLRNALGTVNNGFQGDLRVATLQPIANGANQGWSARSIQKLGVGVLRVDDNGDRNSSVTFADNVALELGASSYTIEGFFRFEDTPILSERFGLASKWRTDTDNRSWKLALNGPDVGGTLEFRTSSDGTTGDEVSVHAFPFTPETNKYFHIAVSRDGTSSRMFIAGVQVGITKTDSRTYFEGDALLAISGEMGGVTSVADLSGLEGWVDGFRLTVGVARYTSNFTPPTAPLPITVGGDPLFNSVELLMNFDNDAVTDQSSNAFTGVLRNGAVQEIPDDGSAFQTIDGLTPKDNNFVEASLVAATGTLTFVDNPDTTETVTLGGVTYNFEAVLEDTANNVLIGATAEDSLGNLLAAVNLQAGAGILYGTGTVINPDAQLTDLPDFQVLATASTPGLIGNSVDTTVAGALGVDWAIGTSAENNAWRCVAFGNDLFVTVSSSGTANRVMTSSDGVNWFIQSTPEDNDWLGITFGNGLFVAVSFTGAGNRVMTSSDGVNWFIQSSAADSVWRSVAFGNDLFVAVSSSGVANRVMTSSDGVNWFIQSTPEDNSWASITFGNGLFVAVSFTGAGNRVMTSSDGVNWFIQSTPEDNDWFGVTFGNDLFVAIAQTGTANRVMTSSDGVNWFTQSTPEDIAWLSITFGNGLFVAVASTGAGNRVMTSADGVNWFIQSTPENNAWRSVAFGNDLFVAVSDTGTGNRAMVSSPTTTDMSWSAATLLDGLDIPANSEFSLSALPAEVTGIRAVSIINRAFKTDSGSSEVRTSFVGSGGASLQGAARPVTVSPTYFEDTFETDPDTAGDITPSTLTGARIRLDRTT